MRNTSHIILQKNRSGALMSKRDVSVVEYGLAVERMCLTETAGKPRDGGQCKTRVVNPLRKVTPLGRINASGVAGSGWIFHASHCKPLQAMPRSKWQMGGGVEKGRKIESAWSGYSLLSFAGPCSPLRQPPAPPQQPNPSPAAWIA